MGIEQLRLRRSGKLFESFHEYGICNQSSCCPVQVRMDVFPVEMIFEMTGLEADVNIRRRSRFCTAVDNKVPTLSCRASRP